MHQIIFVEQSIPSRIFGGRQKFNQMIVFFLDSPFSGVSFSRTKITKCSTVQTRQTASRHNAMMLHQFIQTNRTILIERCRGLVAGRSDSKIAGPELTHGIPVFLDQLIATLVAEKALESRRLVEPREPESCANDKVEGMAALHGQDLRQQGYTIEQVVRDYGDVCQTVTNLAVETGASISVEEFRTFNRCLDEAIAGAVTEYSKFALPSCEETLQALNARLGPLAHELRNYLHAATLVVAAIKTGNVGMSGATAAVLDRSLLGMRNLIDRSLAEVRVTAGIAPRLQFVKVLSVVRDVEAAAALDAVDRGCQFTVLPVDANIMIYVDREMLVAALGNLLHNAFKFTKRHTEVWLRVRTIPGRVLIDVEDHCGGLPKGSPEQLFASFAQHGDDRSGLGLGLEICRRSVEAVKGSLNICDVPGSGCIFTIDLPRHTLT